MNFEVRPEVEQDRQGIWNLNWAAFESDAEADLVDALRDGDFVAVSLVAEAAGKVVGHILFSRLDILTNTGSVPALALAPMAVLPSHQRQGIGSQLVTAGLATCQRLGHSIVLVLGHPEFYPRFGFSQELARPLESPFGGGEAWMATELVPDALDDITGKVRFPAPFGQFV